MGKIDYGQSQVGVVDHERHLCGDGGSATRGDRITAGEFQFEIELLRERIRVLELERENSQVAGKKHGLGLGHKVQKEPIPN